MMVGSSGWRLLLALASLLWAPGHGQPRGEGRGGVGVGCADSACPHPHRGLWGAPCPCWAQRVRGCGGLFSPLLLHLCGCRSPFFSRSGGGGHSARPPPPGRPLPLWGPGNAEKGPGEGRGRGHGSCPLPGAGGGDLGAAPSPREMGGPQPWVPPCWGSAVADANRLKPLFFGVKGDEKPSPGVRERRREDVTEPIYRSFLSSHVVPLRTARGGRFVPGAAPGEFGWRAGAEPGSARVRSGVLGCQLQRWSRQVLLLGVLLLLLEPAAGPALSAAAGTARHGTARQSPAASGLS